MTSPQRKFMVRTAFSLLEQVGEDLANDPLSEQSLEVLRHLAVGQRACQIIHINLSRHSFVVPNRVVDFNKWDKKLRNKKDKLV